MAPDLLDSLSEGEEGEFIVFLGEQADVYRETSMVDKRTNGQYVFRQLRATARRTQAPLLELIRETGAEHRAYWIANMIWVQGGRDHVQMLASRPEVRAVYANQYRDIDLPDVVAESSLLDPQGVEWNIAHIGAPDVWALGVTGHGVVIGGQDTGYAWEHPALIGKYRGWDGQTANHDYNWHDAVHSAGGACGADSAEPCDDHGHGTHTMGTMLGDDGAGNQIGVAPGATWIGCRNMDRGVGSLATYSECFEWFVAPADGNGENPDPDMAPHVVNNSWACPPQEGCGEGEIVVMQTVVENVRAAGIVVVSSAGNSGFLGCSTVQYPPAIYDATLTVGATANMSDAIASFSSRGPVIVDGSNRLKPDVVAPGAGIRSATLGDGYTLSQGTSMASPHVAGLVALLISADPSLAGDVDTIETVITRSAVPLTTTQNCGAISGETIPNNTFGHGRVDALSAYKQLESSLPFRRYFPFFVLQG